MAYSIFQKHPPIWDKTASERERISNMQHEIADMKVDEMQMQSQANMQGKDSYLLHYRGTYITPPYSDKMSREREWVWDHKKERVIKKQRTTKDTYTVTQTENKKLFV